MGVGWELWGGRNLDEGAFDQLQDFLILMLSMKIWLSLYYSYVPSLP